MGFSDHTPKVLAEDELARAIIEHDIAKTVLDKAIANARDYGVSWATIGQGLGITKQAAQQRYGKAPALAKLAEPDLAGPSVTPSIFLEPKAPAKAKTTGLPKTDTWTEPRKHGAILPGPKPITAQPGTGNGPHLCQGCQQTNHHGSKRNTIVWNDGCQPTKYDTQAETDYLNTRTSK